MGRCILTIRRPDVVDSAVILAPYHDGVTIGIHGNRGEPASPDLSLIITGVPQLNPAWAGAIKEEVTIRSEKRKMDIFLK